MKMGLATVAKYKLKEVIQYNYLICADKQRVARNYLVEWVQEKRMEYVYSPDGRA